MRTKAVSVLAIPFFSACVLAIPMASADTASEAPISAMQAAMLEHKDSPVNPELIGDPDAPIIPLSKGLREEKPCMTVFGYLPYWESSTYFHWDKLTHLACFSVEVNANGTLGSDHGWPWTSTINTAHANGVKVILTATNFSPSEILTLITTPSYKNAFFSNIHAKMLEGNADGLNIDFEGSGSYVNYINGFMADLTNYLHAINPDYEVTFAGPAVNWSGWDLLGLANSCDGIFIMGYAFNGSFSSSTGPNAPLGGGTYNLTNTVTVQYAGPLAQCPEKLILGIPYYGHHWTASSSSAGASVISSLGSKEYQYAKNYFTTYGRNWHSSSSTPWTAWHDGSNWNQIWCDDDESLGMKYQLAIDNELGGVGMWALGYDGSRQELWTVLDDMINFDCATICDWDGDGDVDLNDYTFFANCMAGPDSSPNGSPGWTPQECLDAFDTDVDGDVDLQDFGVCQELIANY